MTKVYQYFMQSIMIYGCSVFCNITATALSSFIRLEKRASKIIGKKISPSLDEVFDTIGSRLFNSVKKNSNHPLRQLFKLAVLRRGTTICEVLVAPIPKTERHRRSFIRYANICH